MTKRELNEAVAKALGLKANVQDGVVRTTEWAPDKFSSQHWQTFNPATDLAAGFWALDRLCSDYTIIKQEGDGFRVAILPHGEKSRSFPENAGDFHPDACEPICRVIVGAGG